MKEKSAEKGARARGPTQLQPRVPEEVVQVLAEALGVTDREAALRRGAVEYGANPAPWAAKARALFLVVADLVQQGWRLDVYHGGISATAPNPRPTEGETLTEAKDRLRGSLLAARSAQLRSESVRKFIRRMESLRVHDGQRLSVLALVDDGHELATSLSTIAALPPSDRPAALAKVVDPVLQVVTNEARCEHTGLPLIDVWRYFRHTWSLEYRPTPGRTLMVLVRNAARPFAPVMGIAAVANALPQLRVRDDWIEWTPASFRRRLAREPDAWTAQRDALLRTLEEARELIRADDLLKTAGKVKGEALEARLLSLSADAKARRTANMRERQKRLDDGEDVESLRQLPMGRDGQPDWRKASEDPLFVRKRAKTLADVMFAARVLGAAPADGEDFLSALEESEELERALAVAFKEVRKVGLASRLLEVNVCGAVPPYRELLGGKLVALAMGSADMIAAYRDRYAEQASEIASRLAGRPVVRAPDLCAMTTTSLYGVSASQYNRLRLAVAGPEGPLTIAWRDLGLTQGYGTVHLGEETVAALRRISIAHRGGRNVNNVFGEGNSARLRQVREALDDLGIDSDAILRHSAPRRVYGLELCADAVAALRTNAPTVALAPSFAAVADAWRARWLAMRITNRDVLARVGTQDAEAVRADLDAPPPDQLTLFGGASAVVRPAASTRRSFPMERQPRAEMVQRFYRNVASCADHHDERTVNLIHIETAADEFIRARAAEGAVLFVTGNPGDGKTHLIRRLEAALRAEKVEVCIDANERSDEELVELVERTLRRKSGCVIAINEGILVDLVRSARGRAWADAASAQLLRPFVFDRGEGAPSARGAADRVVVLDLNLRNNLGREVVLKALQSLVTLSGPCEGCPVATCEGQTNAARLMEPGVQDRLSRLLDGVARTGFHATMRDLHGFLSFLLFGGRVCEGIRSERRLLRPYWDSAFDAERSGGQGPLFDAVRAMDPVGIPMPLLDDALWRRADRPDDWLVTGPGASLGGEDMSARQAAFVSKKRRALFEHRDGEAILSAAGTQVDRMLLNLFDQAKADVSGLVRHLNRLFDRDEDRSDALYLWTTHRYDARANRFAAAAASVPTGDLEVVVPQLPPTIAPAFPDYRPDHAVLRRRGTAPEQGLRIDRALVEALVAAEQGLPSNFRRGEPEARVSAFFDRLAKNVGERIQGDRIEVRLVDMDTGQNLRLAVDVAARRYAEEA